MCKNGTVGKNLAIYGVILAVLAISGPSTAQDSSRYPFPVKKNRAEVTVTKKFPFPARSETDVAEDSGGTEILLAEEPVDPSPRSRPGRTRKDTKPQKVAVEQTATLPPPSKNRSSEAATVSPGDVNMLKEHIQRLEDKLLKMEEEKDIRRQLEITDDEKGKKEDAILTAAGRDYTLMKPGILGFEYSLRYAGDTYDSVSDSDSVEHNAYHSITHSMTIEYPVKENLTLNSSVPFVYKYGSQTNTTAKDTSDLGDVSLGFQYQPRKSGSGMMSLILSGSLICPTGRSPFKIDSERELSTGNGYYSLGAGVNVSKNVDPLVTFGGLNYSKGMETTHLNYKPSATSGEEGFYIKEMTPGDVVSFSMGLGYSLSYKASLTFSYQYSYQFKTRFLAVTSEDDGGITGTRQFESEGSISSVFNIGTGWNLTPKRSVNVRLGIGLTNNDPDFSLMVRIPFSYTL